MVWQNTANKPLYYISTFVQSGTSPSHQTLANIVTIRFQKQYLPQVMRNLSFVIRVQIQ